MNFNSAYIVAYLAVTLLKDVSIRLNALKLILKGEYSSLYALTAIYPSGQQRRVTQKGRKKIKGKDNKYVKSYFVQK